jgi:hypothetical protein
MNFSNEPADYTPIGPPIVDAKLVRIDDIQDELPGSIAVGVGAAIRCPAGPCRGHAGYVTRWSHPDDRTRWGQDVLRIDFQPFIRGSWDKCLSCYEPSRKSKQWRGDKYGRSRPALARRRRHGVEATLGDEFGPPRPDELIGVWGVIGPPAGEYLIRCPQCEANRWLRLTWQAARDALEPPMPHRSLRV